MSFQRKLKEDLAVLGADLVGFADITPFPARLRRDFPRAVSLAVAYKVDAAALKASEELYHRHLTELAWLLDQVSAQGEMLLRQWGFSAEAVPGGIHIADNDQLAHLRTFPHKAAATCAGIGWVGRQDLLITPEYGPRIRLGSILTDAPLEISRPVLTGDCGDCQQCVDACPYRAVKGGLWERGAAREKMLNAFLCNEKRLTFIPRLGRKSSCGLCLLACPVGRS